MAVTTFQDFYGWEVGAGYGIAPSGAGTLYLNDGTARTGCYYGKCLLSATNGNTFVRAIPTALALPGNTTSSFDLRAAFYLRINTPPDVNNTGILDYGNGSGGLPIDMGMWLNTDRTWSLFNNFLAPASVTGGTALPLNTWIPVIVRFNWKRTGGVSDSVILELTVNGQLLTMSATFANLLALGANVDRIGLGSVGFGTLGGLSAGEVHFDDLVFKMQLNTTATTASVTLPSSTRIRLVPITAQGLEAAWTGSYTDLQEVPLNTSGAGQTSSGAGQVTTFQHNTAVSLGISAIDAIKVYGYLKATVAGPTTQQIRVNGVDFPVSIRDIFQGGNAAPLAVDFTPYTLPTFNLLEFGAVNSTGASLTLGAIHGEVLYTETSTNWFGCGLDPCAPPPGCVLTFGVGTDSGGGVGCQAGVPVGSDSGGGVGCSVTLPSVNPCGGGA